MYLRSASSGCIGAATFVLWLCQNCWFITAIGLLDHVNFRMGNPSNAIRPSGLTTAKLIYAGICMSFTHVIPP